MKFYQACIRVAESVIARMTPQQIDAFIQTDEAHLEDYQLSMGMWIRDHMLPDDAYLCAALEALGMRHPMDMSLYLIRFTKQYLVLKQKNLI